MKSVRAKGFSLIELVAVIVVISVAAVGFTAAYAPLVRSPQITQDIDFAAQLAARCAEHVLGQRRINAAVGFAGIAGNMCSALNANGFTVSTAVSALVGGACPASRTCKAVVITATDGSTARTQDLLVANY